MPVEFDPSPSQPDPRSGAVDTSTLNYIRSRDIARYYDATFQDNELFEYDTTLLERWFDEPATLVDLGCGTGRHVLHFARRHFSVTGVDLSWHMLELTRRKVEAEQLMARLVRGDLTAGLPFLQERFYRYAICMFSTLGMIRGHRNRVAFLSRVRQLLKPGGLLALHVHNRFTNARYIDGLAWLVKNYTLDRLRGIEPGDRWLSVYRGVKRLYIHNFTDREVKRLVAEAGFDLVELVYLNKRRNGRMSGAFKSLRCNGYVALCRNPVVIPDEET